MLAYHFDALSGHERGASLARFGGGRHKSFDKRYAGLSKAVSGLSRFFVHCFLAKGANRVFGICIQIPALATKRRSTPTVTFKQS